MKKTIITACLLAIASVAPAMAWDGKVVACYKKHWVQPSYKVSKVLVMDGHKKYEHRGHHVVEVWYPPVYKEVKTQLTNGHYIMKKSHCH
ncbi:hypothetical protein [Pseudooceanicola aestuarii]|uniref:hypothetical protein n=1 Tax=Pseudooceanicola aestuarii TaxID=2697319 RepID=UPI0013D572C0|nr:hypothetical protein [Pseudooceanicola aestuarii]